MRDSGKGSISLLKMRCLNRFWCQIAILGFGHFDIDDDIHPAGEYHHHVIIDILRMTCARTCVQGPNTGPKRGHFQGSIWHPAKRPVLQVLRMGGFRDAQKDDITPWGDVMTCHVRCVI